MELQIQKITPRGNFIGGQFRRPHMIEGSFEKNSPADIQDGLGCFEWSTQDVDRAVEAAQKAFTSWFRAGADFRKAKLLSLQNIFKQKKESLAQILMRDVGKALWEANAEIDALVAKIDITLNEGAKDIQENWFENLAGAETKGGWRYKPLGVVAVLGPFNFPAHLPNGHWIPALALGNTVVFKPSEFAPAIGQAITECFELADFPPGVFNLVQGARAVGEALVANPKVSGVFFTGSFQVGLAIKKATLLQPQKLLALEMGGKNSTVVCEDAHLDLAVSETIQSAFLTTGQRCSATSRVFVHESIFDSFAEKLVSLTQNLTVGYPSQNPFMGPLIHEKSMSVYLGINETLKVKSSFALPIKPETLSPEGKVGHYVRPSVSIFQSKEFSEVFGEEFFKEELFSPHVTLIRFNSFDESIAGVNSTPYGLVSSVFTTSPENFEKFFLGVECGLINWNKGTIGASSKLPFGGVKKSGNYFPSALFAGRYCGYPVSSIQNPNSKFTVPQVPGFNWR